MFDLFTGRVQHVPSTPAIPILISTTVQGTALAVIVFASLLVATHQLPPTPSVWAFAAEVPTVAPPPPPPPAAAPSQARVVSPKAVPASPDNAPIEAPARIEPEAPAVASVAEGVPGGVEGGIAQGVVGGTLGVIESFNPPPPAPVSREPVRIGGQVQAPALLKRVEPIYPALAQFAAIDGIVILDAIVDEHGRVQSLKVLRGHPVLAKAATEAVEQWIYEPLRLNGAPTSFELTVSLWFHFDDKPKRRS